MASHDVTIKGAGIFGLSIAWACVKRGARVQVIDPYGPGAGASGGIVGALAPHVPENWNAKKQFQLESLLAAEAFWADVQAVGGRAPGYVRSGRVQPILDEAGLALAQARASGAAELWRGKAVWEVERVGADWEPVSPSGWLIRDDLSALIHPRQACAALVAALAARGVVVVPDAQDSGAVVWATGAAGLDELSVQHTRSMGQGIKGQAALVQLDKAGAAQLFADGVHVIPHLDGTVAIGSTTEREFKDAMATDGLLDDLVDKARMLVPALSKAPVIARWAGLRPRARSRAPMLGPWPDRKGHFVANGGFKIGYGMAPKVADVMADLVLEGINTVPEGFDVASSM